MSKEKYNVIRVAKQLPYISNEDIRRMLEDITSINDCYRIMKQRRQDW